MSDGQQRDGLVEIEVAAATLDSICELLELPRDFAEGTQTPLGQEATLTVSDVSKSSGFDATTVILTGVINLAFSTTGAVLVDWLKTKLQESRKTAAPTATGKASDVQRITLTVGGKKVDIDIAGGAGV